MNNQPPPGPYSSTQPPIQSQRPGFPSPQYGNSTSQYQYQYGAPPTSTTGAGDRETVPAQARANGPYPPGPMPPRPPLAGGPPPPGPGQWAPPRPPVSTNGYGAPPPGPSAINPNNPSSAFNPSAIPNRPPLIRPPTSQPSNNTPFPPSSQMPSQIPANSMGMPPKSIPGQSIIPPSMPSSVAPSTGFSPAVNRRPGELPVPYHGQGQYSHQVNPLLLQTPNNSEPPSLKNSRQPSPVSGNAIDALEGQFTPVSAPGPPPPGALPPGAGAPPMPGAAPPPATGAPSIPAVQPGQVPPRLTQQPPAVTGASQPPAPHGFPPRPGFQHNALPPQTSQPGLPPSYPPTSSAQPPPPASHQGSRNPPPPTSSAAYPPPPTVPGYPPSAQPAAYHPNFMPPSSMPPSSMPPSMPPSSMPPSMPASSMPPTSMPPSVPPMGQPGMPPMGQPGMPPPPSQFGTGPPSGPASGKYPQQPAQGYNNVNALTNNFGQMGVQDVQRPVNLLNERKIVPPEGVETAKPVLPHDYKKVNCSPDVFRCTLNAIPQTSGLLSKARLPLGILIHPFRDLSQLPVIQSSVIVRCRSCRTYINPFVVFIDQRRWKCNLCFRVNELPEEFSFDPVTKTYGDPQRRPEIKSATIEFIAPSEYMLRPPQPAVYLFLLDVSFNAVETGYLGQFCQTLLDELDKLPGDARTTVGFLCYDRALYYFNLAEGLAQPQMLCVPDLEEVFLPTPDNLLVNLQESKELVTDLLGQLPGLFQGNTETGSALGAALKAAHKMMSSTGGRVTVMQTCLPTVGPGALENRDTGNKDGKNVTNLGPANDFYKKLSLDCSAQQIAVDLFMLNGQYADIATLSCISKFSAGCVYHYPSFHTIRTPSLVDKFDTDLRRYLTRKIGFESVMRIRCTRGLSIHTFHGNFFVRSTDLLSLPNVNPDAGFGMQMSIEDTLNESTTVSFQAALLYTSSKGERRIRVHTLCIPVTNQISEVFAGADQQAVAGLLAKMAVDRSLNSAVSDARDAMINAPVDTLGAYAQQIPASQRVGALMAPLSLRLMPMYMLAMLKSAAFSLATKTSLDERVFAMQQCKTQPLCYLLQSLYPNLYPLLQLSHQTPLKKCKEEEVAGAPLLQLSSANVDRAGVFLMDAGEAMYMLVGSATPTQVIQDLFDLPSFSAIPDDLTDLPELENALSETVRNFVNVLMDTRPHGITFLVIRDDSKHRHLFFQYMLEDRTENSMSYYEFLQFLQGKSKG